MANLNNESRIILSILLLFLSLPFYFSWLFIILLALSMSFALPLLHTVGTIEVKGYKQEIYPPKERS